jgi:hypothetical protein
MASLIHLALSAKRLATTPGVIAISPIHDLNANGVASNSLGLHRRCYPR